MFLKTYAVRKTNQRRSISNVHNSWLIEQLYDNELYVHKYVNTENVPYNYQHAVLASIFYNITMHSYRYRYGLRKPGAWSPETAKVAQIFKAQVVADYTTL